MEDGNSAHGHKSTRNCCAKWRTAHGIILMPHPSTSPDMNPIEKCWRRIKQALHRRRKQPTTVAQNKSDTSQYPSRKHKHNFERGGIQNVPISRLQPAGTFITPICDCRGLVHYVCLVFSCLLVVDRRIIAFEPYRPFVGAIWGKGMNLDISFVLSKSCVAYRHDQHRVCQRACRLGGCSSSSEEEFEFDNVAIVLVAKGGCGVGRER